MCDQSTKLNPRAPELHLSLLQDIERTRERFWSYVDRTGDCWLWTRAIVEGRYGVAYCTYGDSRPGKTRLYSHRLAYLLTYGHIPAGMDVCHTCDVMACCRPAHLFLGTPADNFHDLMAKGRFNAGGRRKGSAQPHAKMTEKSVAEARRRYAAGEGGHQLAREYGVSESAMAKALRGEQWKHVDAPIPQMRRGNGKLTAERVGEIRRRHADGESMKAIANAVGISDSSVQMVVTRRTWKHVE